MQSPPSFNMRPPSLSSLILYPLSLLSLSSLPALLEVATGATADRALVFQRGQPQDVLCKREKENDRAEFLREKSWRGVVPGLA
jgi:hypothetical protein